MYSCDDELYAKDVELTMRGAKRSNTRTYAQALRLLSYNYSESIDANVEILGDKVHGS